MQSVGDERESDPELRNDEDDEKHEKLLEAIRNLDGRSSGGSKYKLEQRCEPAAEVSEFHLSQGGKGYVKLHELMRSLKTSKKYETIKKQLGAVKNKKATLPAPLPKPQVERIRRGIAYGKVTSELGKWDSVVETNRDASKLIFPLKQPDLRIQSSTEFIKRFQPKTPLEMEVSKLLQESENVIQSGKDLSKAETLALKAMSLKEAQECRRQLQRMRALASYQEAKARRQKKIKSKRYHRILKREKIRKEMKEFEELKKTNPELAAEKLKELDKRRIEERMTLKHRSTGKWAKQQKLRAKYDDSAREALNQQLQLNRELTTKAVVFSDSDEADEVREVGERSANDAQDKFFVPLNYNPWLKDPSTEELSGPPVGSGTMDSYRKSETIVVERDEMSNEPLELLSGADSYKDEKAEAQSEAEIHSNDDVQKNECVNQTGEDEDTSVNQKQMRKKKRKKASLSKSGTSKPKEETLRQRKNDAIDFEDDEPEEEGQMVESLTRKQTMEDFEEMQADVDDVTEDGGSLKRLTKSKTVIDNERETNLQDDKIELDPNKIITVKTKVLKSAAPEIVTVGDEDEDDEQDQQRMLIAEAFADDDIVEEFKAEKEEAEENKKPKSYNLSLPGWGSWAGPGIQPRQRKKRLMSTKPPPPKKPHTELGNVIFSEKKNEKLQSKMVKELPYPFLSVRQFESSICQPIGTTWNPESVFEKLTEPAVVTKLGTIIDPIDSDALLKTQPTKGSKPAHSNAAAPLIIPI